MHRIEVLEQSGKARLLAALLLNACFLVFTVLIVRIGFESNDDLALAAYVDGQMAVSTAHVPYLNIVLGALLKGIYDLLGRAAAWHTRKYCCSSSCSCETGKREATVARLRHTSSTGRMRRHLTLPYLSS